MLRGFGNLVATRCDILGAANRASAHALEQHFLLAKQVQHHAISTISIYTLSDLGVLSNLIGLLSRANVHYSPPTE